MIRVLSNLPAARVIVPSPAVARCAAIVTMSAGTIYDEALAGWRRIDLPIRGLRNVTKIERVFINFEPHGRLALDPS